MASVEYTELHKKVLKNCSFLWNQGVINQANKILEVCKGKADVQRFFEECEDSIKNPAGCKLMWNPYIQTFGGDEFAYILLFFSEILNVAIKFAFNIETFENIVVIGNMEIAGSKEFKKLKKEIDIEKEKNLNNPQSLNSEEVDKK